MDRKKALETIHEHFMKFKVAPPVVFRSDEVVIAAGKEAQKALDKKRSPVTEQWMIENFPTGLDKEDLI